MKYCILSFLFLFANISIEAKNEEAKAYVAELIPDNIDILHIDGNHSEESAMLDVLTYLPKVRHGGYIWFDDIKLKNSCGEYTTHQALNRLLEECNIIDEYFNFLLLRKKEIPNKSTDL